MSYLARLKAEFSEKRHLGEVTKLTEGPSVTSVTEPSRHFPEIEPAEETSGHWLIVQQSEKLERWFSLPVTRAELAQRYRGATLVALVETGASRPRPATAQEATEIRQLVTDIAAQEGFSDAERAEALASALRDPEAVLRCLRELLAEGGR